MASREKYSAYTERAAAGRRQSSLLTGLLVHLRRVDGRLCHGLACVPELVAGGVAGGGAASLAGAVPEGDGSAQVESLD